MLLLIFPRKLREKILVHPPLATFVRLLVVLTIMFFVLACLLYVIEGKGWEIAYWMSWETLSTVGYGDYPAETSLGRVLTIIAGSVGIAMMTGTIGATVVLFSYRENRRRTGQMRNPLRDGYVLFNFPGVQQALSFIHEVREVEPNVGVCFVDSVLEELPVALKSLPKVHYVRGSSLDRSTYERAAVNSNKAALIFPKDANNVESDGHTRTTVDLLTHYVHDGVRILHVLVDPRHQWMFQTLNSTGVLECLEVLALVQECQDPHSALIAEHLLRNSEGANPKTMPIGRLAGHTWYDLQQAVFEVAHALNANVNPLALIRRGEVHTCPSTYEKIQEGDELSIVAFNNFDCRWFEEHLALALAKKQRDTEAREMASLS